MYTPPSPSHTIAPSPNEPFAKSPDGDRTTFNKKVVRVIVYFLPTGTRVLEGGKKNNKKQNNPAFLGYRLIILFAVLIGLSVYCLSKNTAIFPPC